MSDVRRTLAAAAARRPGLRDEIEIPPPAHFKERRRLVMIRRRADRPGGDQGLPRGHRPRAPRAIGPVLPHAYGADGTCHRHRVSPVRPRVIRGGADEDETCVLVGERVTAARVITVTALDVCQRAELVLSTPPADRFRAAAPRAS